MLICALIPLGYDCYCLWHSQGLMFHKDFKKQCEAADTVREALPTLYDRVYAVLDLMFR